MAPGSGNTGIRKSVRRDSRRFGELGRQRVTLNKSLGVELLTRMIATQSITRVVFAEAEAHLHGSRCNGERRHKTAGMLRNRRTICLCGIRNERINPPLHLFIFILLDTCVVNPDCDAFRIELVVLDECLDAAADNAVLEVALEVATFPVHATLR